MLIITWSNCYTVFYWFHHTDTKDIVVAWFLFLVYMNEFQLLFELIILEDWLTVCLEFRVLIFSFFYFFFITFLWWYGWHIRWFFIFFFKPFSIIILPSIKLAGSYLESIFFLLPSEISFHLSNRSLAVHYII